MWNNEVKIHTRTQMCAAVMIKESCPQTTSHLHNCRVQSPPRRDTLAEREARPWMVNIKDSSRLQRTWSWSWS